MKKKKKRIVGGTKPDAITEKEKRFCEEYIKDFNAGRAYRLVYGSKGNDNTCRTEGWRLVRVPRVWEYFQSIQKDVEKVAGITRAMVVQAHKDIAYSTIAHLHKTWVEREEFESLTEQQKASIQEIDTKVVTKGVGKKKTSKEYVRIKLYDRQKSLDALSRMCGYDEPSKLELSGNKELIAGMFPFGK